MKTKSLFILLFTILCSLNLFASGRTVGNGGDVVVCKNNSDQIVSIELLDFYEGKVLRHILPDLGENNLSLNEKLEIALQRLNRVSPKRASIYRTQVQTFFEDSLFLADTDFVDIPDSNHIVLPKNCSIQQIANQTTPIYKDDKRFFINKSLWDLLDNDNRTGLILHEIIYREALSIGHTNSISTRILNSNITSKKIEAMSIEEFTHFLIELEFQSNNIQGVDILFNESTKNDLKFFPNGNLQFGHVTSDSQFFWNNQFFYLRDTVEFYENGQIKHFYLKGPHVSIYMNQNVNFGPYDVFIYENGYLQSATFNSELNLNSPHYDLNLKGVLSWYPNGQFKFGLATSGKVMVQNHWISIDKLIVLYENGLPNEIEFAKPEFLFWNNQNLEWTNRLKLTNSGGLLKGVLNKPTAIKTHGTLISFTNSYPITFFEDSSEIRIGCLNSNLQYKDPSGKVHNLKAGQIIEWQENGTLIEKP